MTVLNRFSNLSVQFTDCVDDMKEYFLDQVCFIFLKILMDHIKIILKTFKKNPKIDENPHKKYKTPHTQKKQKCTNGMPPL